MGVYINIKNIYSVQLWDPRGAILPKQQVPLARHCQQQVLSPHRDEPLAGRPQRSPRVGSAANTTIRVVKRRPRIANVLATRFDPSFTLKELEAYLFKKTQYYYRLHQTAVEMS